VEYSRTKRPLCPCRLPGYADYVKNMITGRLRWTAPFWLSPLLTPDAAAREHILLARQVGVPSIVVFLNKVDMVDDAELLDLVEMKCRDLLTQYEFRATKFRSSGEARLRR